MVTNVQHDDRCEPQEPPPTPEPQQEEMCEGTITGTIRMECCCCKPRTQTFVVPIGPQTEASLWAYVQNTVNSYENAGYTIQNVGVVDTGAGWGMVLTVGWCE